MPGQWAVDGLFRGTARSNFDLTDAVANLWRGKLENAPIIVKRLVKYILPWNINALIGVTGVAPPPLAGLWCAFVWGIVSTIMESAVRERINDALKVAVKAQDKIRMSTLRLINAAIKDRDIASRTDGANGGVPDSEVMAILAKMIKQRDESAVTYEQAGRLELAEQEKDEIIVIKEFLPKQLDDAEMSAVCEGVIAELGAAGLKDMGRTMGVLKERYAGQMDFGKASKLVKGLLEQA